MEKSFKRERVISSANEVKAIINLIQKYSLKVIKIGKGGDYASMKEYLAKHNNKKPALEWNIIIELKETKLEITTKFYNNIGPCTFKFNLNEEEMFANSGHKCFAEFSRHYKIPKAKSYQNTLLEQWFNDEKGSYTCSASPLIGFNKKYEGIEIFDVWEYDINSAYSAVMINKIPDLWHPLFRKNQKVKKGYVGFYIDDDLTLSLEGGFADVTFPLIDCPPKLKEFCERYYNKKQHSTGIDKKEAKAMLNLPIGYCQRYNPFLRSYIVHMCNINIINKLDSKCILWNTDAFFTTVRRNDIEIGEDIGQFKEKHFKVVRYIGNSYQIDDELPVWRGVPKQWFKRFKQENGRAFNILLDPIPSDNNLWSWDWEKLSLRRNYEKG